MKLRTFIAALAVAFTSALPLSAVESSPALEKFKTEMSAIEAYTKEQEAAVKQNPMAGIAMLRNMVGKLKGVATADLPADLKEGWDGFVVAISKVADMFKGWPEKPEEMQAFIVKKAMEEPKFMEEFGAKMQDIEKEVTPAVAKLEELGKKYGIEGVKSLAPK